MSEVAIVKLQQVYDDVVDWIYGEGRHMSGQEMEHYRDEYKRDCLSPQVLDRVRPELIRLKEKST